MNRRDFYTKAMGFAAGLPLVGVLLAKNTSAAVRRRGAEPYLGEITMFAGTFAPRGWAFCNGQLLPINQHQALFSLLGTNFGGDGRTSFGLPDLRGRAPIHTGQGPGLSYRFLGERGGVEQIALTSGEMPLHKHHIHATAGKATSTNPVGRGLASSRLVGYADLPPDPVQAMAEQCMSETGGSQPHQNMPPFLGINYIIAIQGIYPPRN